MSENAFPKSREKFEDRHSFLNNKFIELKKQDNCNIIVLQKGGVCDG